MRAPAIPVEVALDPSGSALAPTIAAAAAACGALFLPDALAVVRSADRSAADRRAVDLPVRVWVSDRSAGGTRTGPDVLAIGSDPSAWDSVEAGDPRLGRALANLIETAALRASVLHERATVEGLNRIGYALAGRTDRRDLLDELLAQATDLLCADGGTIYLHDEGRLRFGAARNDTVPFHTTRTELPVDDTSLVGFVVRHAVPLNVPDVRALPADAPYRPNLSFDTRTGYTTRSMLLVPLLDRTGAVLGAMALVNRKPAARVPIVDFRVVSAFSERDLALARSVAAQASVALENRRLYRDIERLFRGFVEASVTAIEARDPSTGGHSHRVAALTVKLAREVGDNDHPAFRGMHFTGTELTELHYAALLHDFGKVGVREEVLLKAQRLQRWEVDAVALRFRLAAAEMTLAGLREGLAEAELKGRLAVLDTDLALVRRVNRPGVALTPPDRAAIEAIAARWHLREAGEPVLGGPQVHRLCFSLGSLDPEERAEMESHVQHTWEFLSCIPWTKNLRRVPDLAYAHHEKLDGTGYPRKLSAADIPTGAKLMTIADIFDALTAGDRPYKTGMSAEHAIDILREEAADGKVWREAVELLAARRLWVA